MLDAITFIIPLINFILLFERKKKWVRSKFKWLIITILFGFGLFTFNNPEFSHFAIPRIVSWLIMTPLIFSILDLLIMRLSYIFQNRDLYLWLRGSTEIDNLSFSGGKHVKWSDRVLSLILLFSVTFLSYAGMSIFK